MIRKHLDFIVFLCLFINFILSQSELLESEYCDTRECVISASSVDLAINHTANPCDDFHEFVCGNYANNTVIHDRFGDHRYFDDATKKDKLLFRKLLESKVNSSDSRALRSMKIFYQTCVNSDKLDEVGSEPLFEVFKGFGGFPLFSDDWNETSNDWVSLNNKIMQAGYIQSYLINLYVEADYRDASKHIIKSQPPDENRLSKCKAYLQYGLEKDEVKEYHEYMLKYMAKLGANEDRAKTEMLDVLDFEIALCKLTLLDTSDKKYYFSIDTVNQMFPYLNWTNFIEIQLGGTTRIHGSIEVEFKKLKFFESLGEFMEKQPMRVVANYLLWRCADESKGYMSNRIIEASINIYKKLFGIVRINERWAVCQNEMTRLFSVGFLALNARKSKIQSDTNSDLIIKLVKEEAEKYVAYAFASNAELHQKISKTRVIFKAPDEYFSDEIIDKFYEGIDIVEGENFQNNLVMNQLLLRKYGERLFKTVDEALWETLADGIFDVSYYAPDKKIIFLSSSVFLRPFYEPKRPNYANYAGIGHEVANFFAFAINQEARDLDIQSFRERSACIQSQYERYVEENLNISVNASIASLRNNADILAYYFSYNAYKNWKSLTTARDLRLPGLFYSTDQFFWILAAQQFCSVDRDINVAREKAITKYPLNTFRIFNPLRSIADFAKDFGCPFGSSMNLKDKC